MRTFLSYDVTDQSVIRRITDIQKELIATGADLKLVKPEILHFTIRFLGEINQQEMEKIIKVLKGYVKPLSDVEVHFKRIGTFPSENRISVIWIGSDADSGKKLEEQARFVNTRLDSEIPTLRKESGERFSPHLTISRVRTAQNKEKLIQFLQTRRNEDFGTARIGNLRLKLSELTPSGPNYTDLHIFDRAHD